MEKQTETSETVALQRLRREWLAYLLAGGLFIGIGFLTIRAAWAGQDALIWLGATLAIAGYQFYYLGRHLGDNRPKGADRTPLFPDLGLANGFTIVRGVLTSALAGFLFVPRPEGWLAWAPGILYLTSSIMDYFDGYIARITGRTTVLGEDLDMRWDGVAMLMGVILSVLYRQTPVPYLLVGLARHLYVFALWLRDRRGLPVYDLPPSRFRRPMAGSQMIFLAVILLPVFRPPSSQIVAVVFMTPFLVAFLYDYLWVIGRIPRPAAGQVSRPLSLLKRIAGVLPLVFRGLLLALLGNLIVYQLRQPSPNIEIIVIAGLAVPALLLGVAGRVFAMAVGLVAWFGVQAAPLEGRYWFLLFVSIILLMTGTGRYSLWKPEEWLMYRRAGERTVHQ